MNLPSSMNGPIGMSGPTGMSGPPAKAWWRYGYVWLVIAGPALVVVAAIATAWIAVTHPDPVLAEDYYRQGIEINKTLAAGRQGALAAGGDRGGKAMMPALQGRNHAATPVQP